MAKSATQVTISVDQLAERAKNIAEIDSKIAAASGNDAQIRKAVVDEMLAGNSDQVGTLYEQVLSQFKALDGPVLVGLISRLEDAMKGDLKTAIDGIVGEQVKARANVEGVDVDKLKEQRKAELELFRALKTMLDSLGLDTTEVSEPKARTGRPAGSGSSKSGKNKEGYRYAIDGKDRPDSQNSFSSVAFYATTGLTDPSGDAMEGKELVKVEGENAEKSRVPAKALRNFLANQGVKFGEDDTWSVTLPNNKVVSARRESVETPAETTQTPEPANA